jgi:pilus assembly protein CpaC
MIAGLMSNSAQSTIDKAPGVGDVPILGNLFRSRAFRKGESELVIVVTPYLVKPVNDGDIKLPTDGFRASGELQSFLGFRENAGESGAVRPGPTAKSSDAPNPEVGSYDPSAVRPGNQNSQRQAQKNPRQQDRRAEAAKPGFSF